MVVFLAATHTHTHDARTGETGAGANIHLLQLGIKNLAFEAAAATAAVILSANRM